MKKTFSLLPLLFVLSAFAQDDSTASKTASLKFDLNFLNNNVYQGRKDSQTISYLAPGLYYNAASGFHASASASFLTQEKKFDLFALDAGYDFSTGNVDAGFTASKYFYAGQSLNVASELSGSLSGFVAYSFPFLHTTLDGSVSLGGNKPDYAASFGVDHSFLTRDSAFSFTPAFSINAGTQNFYESYYNSRRYGKGRRGRNLLVTAQSPNAGAFKLLSYEFSASAEYQAGNFSVYFEPVYAIPQNPAALTLSVKPPNGPAVVKSFSEKLENSFYWTLGMSYGLRWKKKEGQ